MISHEKLIEALANAAVYATWPEGSVGWTKMGKRQREPRVGDLVMVMPTLAPAFQNIGLLRSISPGANEYTTSYLIDCLDGKQRIWSNVRVNALPVGNPFGETVDEKFDASELVKP